MNSQSPIQDELRSLNSSLPPQNEPPYTVPAGYFEGLASVVLARVKAEESPLEEIASLSPLLASLPKNVPYTVPAFYFEANAIASGSEDPESPLLNAVGLTMPYAVPDGYFDNLPAALVNKVSAPKAKVVPLFARTWMRAAVAALVAGALLFGGLQLLTNTSEVPTTAQQPDSTIQPQLANNAPAVLEKDLTEATTKELEAFMATVPMSQIKPAPKEPATEKANVEQLLKDVPTKEVENFLSTLPLFEDDDLLITD